MAELRIFTIGQVADLVQLSTRTVERAIASGDLEASRLTRSRGGWRIEEAAIYRWLERRSNRSLAVGILAGDRPSDLARLQPRRPARTLRVSPDMGRS
jgi:excisionase family DNA binding protein